MALDSVTVIADNGITSTEALPFYLEEDEEGSRSGRWWAYCKTCHTCLGSHWSPLLAYIHKEELMTKIRKHLCEVSPR